MITVDEAPLALSAAVTDESSGEFDVYADAYEEALQQGLKVSGENPEYFARRRIEWTRSLLDSHGMAINKVLDFGCGVGIAIPLIEEILQPSCIWGFDPSTEAIERAKKGSRNRFVANVEELPAAEFDLVYTNGVFHHIPPVLRRAAFSTIWRTLRAGGWFAFWENNPWNLGTRLVMSRIPFDRDAVTISPVEANRLLRSAGFNTVRTDAWFLFPHMLRSLRPLEWLVHRIPLGAQYLVLAQKPTDG